MEMSLDLLGNAIVSGLLLGGFYAAVTIGVSISFGMLDIVNIAHPAFIILGSYIAYIANANFGIDPIVASVIAPLRVLFLLGMACIRSITSRSNGAATKRCGGWRSFRSAVHHRGPAGAGVRRGLSPGRCTPSGPSLHLGVVDLPLRLLVPCLVALVMVGGLQLFMSRTFLGRAILAVAQDQLALRLMAANPTRIKRIAFGLSIATASVAGAVLIVIQPVEPSIGRDYIGRVFAICVLGGMGSFAGTVVAAMALGIVESLTATFYGPSWAPAVAFGFLLVTLAVRPAGIFGR